MNVADCLSLVSNTHSVVLKVVDRIDESAESAPITSSVHDPQDMGRIGNLMNSLQTPNLTLSTGSLQFNQDNNTQNDYIGAFIHAWKAANQRDKYWAFMQEGAELEEQFLSGLYSTLFVADTTENAQAYLAGLQGSGANVYIHPQALDDAANTNPIWIFSCGKEAPPEAECIPDMFGEYFESVIGINLSELTLYERDADAEG